MLDHAVLPLCHEAAIVILTLVQTSGALDANIEACLTWFKYMSIICFEKHIDFLAHPKLAFVVHLGNESCVGVVLLEVYMGLITQWLYRFDYAGNRGQSFTHNGF